MSNISPRDKGPSKVPEYIPIVSTFTGAKKLFDKIRGVADRELNEIKNDPNNIGKKKHEYEWLCSKNESSLRSAAALIPILGNIIVALIDRSAMKHVRAIETNPELLKKETSDYQRQFLLEHKGEISRYLPYVEKPEIIKEWCPDFSHENFQHTHSNYQVDAIASGKVAFDSVSREVQEKYVLFVSYIPSKFTKFFSELSEISKKNVIKQKPDLLIEDRYKTQCIEGLKQLDAEDINEIFTKHPGFVGKMDSKDFAPMFEKMDLETKILVTKKMDQPTKSVTVEMLAAAAVKDEKYLNNLKGDLVIHIMKGSPHLITLLAPKNQAFVLEKEPKVGEYITDYDVIKHIAKNKKELVPYLSVDMKERLLSANLIQEEDMTNFEIQYQSFEKDKMKGLDAKNPKFQKELLLKEPVRFFDQVQDSVKEECFPDLIKQDPNNFEFYFNRLSETNRENIAKKNPEVFEEKVFDTIFDKMNVQAQIECTKNIKDVKRLMHVLGGRRQFVTLLKPERQVAVANEFVKIKKDPTFILKYVDLESGKYIAENKESLIPCLSKRIKEQLVEEKYIPKEDIEAVFDIGQKKGDIKFVSKEDKINYISKCKDENVRLQLMNEDISLVKELPFANQKEWYMENRKESLQRLKETSPEFQLWALKTDEAETVFSYVKDEVKEKYVLNFKGKDFDRKYFFNRLSPPSKFNVVKSAAGLDEGNTFDVFFDYMDINAQADYLRNKAGNIKEIVRILEKIPTLITIYTPESQVNISRYLLQNNKDPKSILGHVDYESAKYIAQNDKGLVRYLSEQNQNALIKDSLVQSGGDLFPGNIPDIEKEGDEKN